MYSLKVYRVQHISIAMNFSTKRRFFIYTFIT